MFCIKSPAKEGRGSFPVFLNVYDLTPMNGYAYWLGLGVFHSGVQVHGTEYCYGAHEGSSTGIFEELPRQYEGCILRKTVRIGATDMSPGEVKALMDGMGKEFSGDAYNLMAKNCNHFCNDACFRLTGNRIPNWINRLANIGLFFNCIVPPTLKSAKVGHIGSENASEDEDKPKLKILIAPPSPGIASPSPGNRSPSLGNESTSPGVAGHRRNHSRNGLSRLQLLI